MPLIRCQYFFVFYQNKEWIDLIRFNTIQLKIILEMRFRIRYKKFIGRTCFKNLPIERESCLNVIQLETV